MNADLLNLDSASCPRPSGRQVLKDWLLKRAYKDAKDSKGVSLAELIS